MVGIGGSGMSGIAEVLINLGYKVSGSDIAPTEVTKHLEKIGARIVYRHRAENVAGTDVVVVSSAIDKTNPEVLAARRKGIPVIPRIEMLAEIARLKHTVAIAGTHGKTTTTSMTALVLQKGGLDPTVIIGGRLKNYGTGAKLGRGDFLVAEADESDGSFLKLSPAISVVTNIDDDHLDYYGTMQCLIQSFVRYINNVPFYGCAILCKDDPVVRSLLKHVTRRHYTYGIASPADFTAEKLTVDSSGSVFYAVRNINSNGKTRKKYLGSINLKIPGRHNVLNALASICCGIELGIPFEKIKKALAEFEGVGRRLEIKGTFSGITVIDDYGHHPTEISNTLQAVREGYPERRVVVVFQPHRYTRTKALYKKFGTSFGDADVVRVCDIYPAGEKPIPGVTSKLILTELKKHKDDVKLFNRNELPGALKPGDVLLTLGAGNVWKIGEDILKHAGITQRI